MKLDCIIQGDCIKELAKLPENSIDLAFADPPFNIGYDYDQYDDRRECDDYLEWSKNWMSGVQRVLRPWGAFWLAIGDEYAAELKVIATRNLGYIARSWVVWYYTFGVNCTSKFTRSHAHLFYFLKPGPAYEGCPPIRKSFNAGSSIPSPNSNGHHSKRVPRASRAAASIDNRQSTIDNPQPIHNPQPIDNQSEPRAQATGLLSIDNRQSPIDNSHRVVFNDSAIRVPSARQLVYGDKRANPKGRLPDDTWILRPQDVPEGFTADSDTWYFPRVCGTFKERAGFHGCQMPEQLLGRIIRACSNEGAIVLDPFAGSGTTLAVAKKLGRRYLGTELSKDYAKQANARLKQTSVGQALNGVADPLTSVPDTSNGRRLHA